TSSARTRPTAWSRPTRSPASGETVSRIIANASCTEIMATTVGELLGYRQLPAVFLPLPHQRERVGVRAFPGHHAMAIIATTVGGLLGYRRLPAARLHPPRQPDSVRVGARPGQRAPA